MTIEDIKKKYSELIPNLASIKDPDREVPRDILMQMVGDIDKMRATQDIPLPWNPTEELGEDITGVDDPDKKGYCINFWQFVWFGGLGAYAWQHGSEQQFGGYQGDGSDASIMGTCATIGESNPSALYRFICLGNEGSHSSALITCEIFIA